MPANASPLAPADRLRKPATAATRRAQDAVQASLPFEDRRAFANAARGFIATLQPLTIMHSQGSRAVYDLAPMGFLAADAPDTVNPSLWRQAQLNALYNGLFEVVPGIWQVRAFDIANMTLVRGDTGWIVIDPLTSSEASRAALALANEHLGARPVRAVIITHSHADHFGGVLGVTSAEEVASGAVTLLAPVGFVQESLSENVLAGNVMNRRATYMYGNLLPPGERAFVTTGLGAALSMGSTGFLVPNDYIVQSGETRVLDGVPIEFQLTPGTEAPAEMVFYFPEHRALCMSEITSHHQHNLYTPRGAQVRDALAWSAQIQESIDRFGDRLEVHFASHHWPTWGRAEVLEYLGQQRDLYKYIHDQSLRLANHGYSMDEIGERLQLPPELAREFSNRGYYGTLNHGAKAVFVKYLGHFDGNPAHLHPLPPVPAGERYVAYMGGADAIAAKAQADFDAGEYRWVAQVLNHVVMAQPDHAPARALLADAYEQLGYQAESAPWRNFYLCGALELREGLPASGEARPSAGIADNMPLDDLFRTMAVRLHAERAQGVRLHIALAFTDTPEPWLLVVERCVLHAYRGRSVAAPTVTLTLESRAFRRLMLGIVTAAELLHSNALSMHGDVSALPTFAGLFDRFERRFPLVTPRA